MVYELADTAKVTALFEGWPETMIWSCLQKVMGKIYVTDLEKPQSAFAFVGCFAFYAGVPDKELIRHKPDAFVIMTPQNEKWADCIEDCFPDAKKISRYAIKKDTKFDKDLLLKLIDKLPEGYELKDIDENIYDVCLSDPVTNDFVSSFESKEKYLEIGRGVVVIKSGRIVAGASSYTRYSEGIEIEVDTVEEERRKELATVASAALILRCLDEGLYPSWDAQNMNSVHLAKKLGYEFDHEYTAYEVSGDYIGGEMTLETKRLILRRWEDSDAENLYRYAKDPDIGPIAGWPAHQSIEESRDVIRNVFNGKEAYAVCLKTDGEAIGAIELKLNGHTDMTDRDDECELGYWIGKSFWGQGIIPEAAKEMIRHGFEDLGMTRIWVGYYEGNTKSKRVQEKCGFRYEWKSEGVDVPLLHEKRTGHVSSMTKEQWLQDRMYT